MQCELCGRDCNDCRSSSVDGVKMMLCPGCMKHGTGLSEVSRVTTDFSQKAIFNRVRKPREKDIYKNMDKELISGWNNLIRKAREKKGLTREELGFRIGERTITISKIENGDLRPSDKMIAKLEKELGISLLEEVKKVTTDHHVRTGMTLGDFIKTEKQ